MIDRNWFYWGGAGIRMVPASERLPASGSLQRRARKILRCSGSKNILFTHSEALCYNPLRSQIREEYFILNANKPSPLPAALDHQDDVFSGAFVLLHEGITQRSFPGASIAVTYAGKLVALKSFGAFVYADETRHLPRGADFESALTTATLLDLASLTKPIATTTMAMLLYERGLLDLDAPIIGTLPEFSKDNPDPRRHDVTFRMLLAHSSGLPAYEKLFLKAHSREELLQAAFTAPLTADPATRAEYSDIGFIILGAALEHIAEESLDVFCQREIFGPLAMSNTTFNPPADLRPKIPPTADERDFCGSGIPARARPSSNPAQGGNPPRSTFRNRIIQGEVQDENAFVLGGVAGHAGLFSTAEDVARFAHALLSCGAGTFAREYSIIRPETFSLFTQRQFVPPGTTRTLGWDTPSTPSQSGKYFGPRSFGHLGYTGTSLWIDPDRQLSITLLTNRTWPDCSNQAIKQIRPRFHDAVITALG